MNAEWSNGNCGGIKGWKCWSACAALRRDEWVEANGRRPPSLRSFCRRQEAIATRRRDRSARRTAPRGRDKSYDSSTSCDKSNFDSSARSSSQAAIFRAVTLICGNVRLFPLIAKKNCQVGRRKCRQQFDQIGPNSNGFLFFCSLAKTFQVRRSQTAATVSAGYAR